MPLNKEGKKPRVKCSSFSSFVIPCVLQHKCQCIALKKQYTKKNNDKTTDYYNSSAKRMKQGKEKCQKLSLETEAVFLRPTSKSQASQNMI